LTSFFYGFDYYVFEIKKKIVSSQTADSKPVKQEVNSTVILPPLVFPAVTLTWPRQVGRCPKFERSFAFNSGVSLTKKLLGKLTHSVL
jgi:hypothetical protein